MSGAQSMHGAEQAHEPRERILVINPGSTSTKVALFEGREERFDETVEHERAALKRFGSVAEQFPYRLEAVEGVLERHGVSGLPLTAVAGRGGLLAPMPGGVWRVDDTMLATLAEGRYGEHPCNLGAPLARHFAERWGVDAYIVDPVVTDEMEPVARMTGFPEIQRRSVFHALNQRAAARVVGERLGVPYAEGCFLVAHMGGGISIGAHRHGRIVDVINALDGDGPFSAERTGTLPLLPVLALLENGMQTFESMKRIVLREGGLWAHCGTNDLRVVEHSIAEGDVRASAVFESLAYNIAKEVASLAPALCGSGERITAVVLTGGMAHSQRLVGRLEELLGWLGPVAVLPGAEEMRALAHGVLDVLRGTANACNYGGNRRLVCS